MDTTQEGVSASHVIHAKGNAVVIAEIKLSEIAVQMLLAAMLVGAFHAALEDAEIVLDGVGVDHRI